MNWVICTSCSSCPSCPSFLSFPSFPSFLDSAFQAYAEIFCLWQTCLNGGFSWLRWGREFVLRWDVDFQLTRALDGMKNWVPSPLSMGVPERELGVVFGRVRSPLGLPRRNPKTPSILSLLSYQRPRRERVGR